MIVNPQFLQAICITFSEHKEFYVFFFFFFLFSTLQFLWIISSFLAFFFSTVRYMLLLLNHFSRVRFCATPWMGVHQAPASLGFSRQEHWSGLPFPSPMHESEKSKWSRSVVSDPQWPHGLQPSRLFHPWDFPGKNTGVGFHCLLWLDIYAYLY